MSSLPAKRAPGSVVVFEVTSGAEQPAESFLAFTSENDSPPLPTPITAVPASIRLSVPAPPRAWRTVAFVGAVVTCAMAATIFAHWSGPQPAASAGTGQLEVLSAPPGAMVTVDGITRGVTPLLLPAMATGTHTVTVTSLDATVTHEVSLQPGAAWTVWAALGPPAHDRPAGGILPDDRRQGR